MHVRCSIDDILLGHRSVAIGNNLDDSVGPVSSAGHFGTNNKFFF